MTRVLLLVALGAMASSCGGSKPAHREPPPQKLLTAEDLARLKETETAEDEPEDGVEFVGTKGRMNEDAIKRGIAPHEAALVDCYMTRVKSRRWLGGQVLLHWDIEEDGTITGVRIAESSLGNWPIEKCLLETARLAVFEPPQGGDTEFELPLEFAARGRVQVWEAEQGLRAVGGQVATLAECASDAAKDRPKGRGRRKAPPKVPAQEPIKNPREAIVTLYIGRDGRATSVGFAGPAFIQDAWADCAEQKALAWRLPEPKGPPARITVQFPLK